MGGDEENLEREKVINKYLLIMFTKMLKSLDFELSEKQTQQFQKLLKLYQDWNAKINLSAIKDEEGIIIKHFYDSLLVSKLNIFSEDNQKIADLGTGGGFPLLPLAIMYPENEFLGVDSVQKKIKVIETIAKELGLKNIQTNSERVETVGQSKKYREQFDIVLTRAFAKWHTLLELSLPLVKTGGKLVAYQGPQILEELEESEKVIEKLGGKIEKLSHFELPEDMGERVFVEIIKIKKTPKEFPRAIGVPKKNPLK